MTRRMGVCAVLLIMVTALSAPALAQVAKFGEVQKKGSYESYISQDGTHYKPGDEVTIGVPQGGNQTFTYVSEYLGFLSESQPCPAIRCTGLAYKIDNFKAGGRSQGFRMWAMLKPASGGRGTLTVNFEAALQSGELIGRGYTSAQALEELRTWKEKLDLELITQDEYDKKKEELSRYIR